MNSDGFEIPNSKDEIFHNNSILPPYENHDILCFIIMSCVRDILGSKVTWKRLALHFTHNIVRALSCYFNAVVK